jgi:trehalose 6-phosphate phosphatase
MKSTYRRASKAIPHLLKNWGDVAKKIRAHPGVTVFLDFDGTLVDIVPRPHQVRLTPAARKILRRLARDPRAALVVISGRRRPELLKYISVPGIHYFGLYGWEGNAKFSLPASIRRALRSARAHLKPVLAAYPKVWIENKSSSFSVHLLEIPKRLQPRVRRQLRASLAPFRKTLHAIENIRDVEILPRSIPGKGKAVNRFLAQAAHRKSFPLYFGDDYSDESGFAAVRRGAGIQVGRPRPTRARYNLRTPAEVAAALTRLEALLGPGPHGRAQPRRAPSANLRVSNDFPAKRNFLYRQAAAKRIRKTIPINRP